MAALAPNWAHATLYRCPSPFGSGSVVTNFDRESEAQAQQCQPLQQRRSTLDGPTRPEPRAAAPKRSVADRISDEWMSSGSKAPAQRAPRPRETTVSAAPVTPVDTRGASERRISADVQRERDSERRTILEAELSKEEQALGRVKQQSKASPAGGEEKQRLDEAVARHVANVDALKRELSRIR